LKGRFLARVADGAQVILTDVASGQERPRSIAACARRHAASETCAVNDIDTRREGQRLLLTLDDGSILARQCRRFRQDDRRIKKCAKGCWREPIGVRLLHAEPHSSLGRRALCRRQQQAAGVHRHSISTPAPNARSTFRAYCDSRDAGRQVALPGVSGARPAGFAAMMSCWRAMASRATLWMLSENGIVRDLQPRSIAP